MGRKRSKQASVLLWAAVVALFSQNLAIPFVCAINFEDQKNFFYPIPDPRTPPTVSYTPPAGGHSTPPPFHGGGGHGDAPPVSCGRPPSGGHHPSTPSPPRGGGGGGYYHSPPTSTPTTPTAHSPPVTLTPPSTPGITVPSPPFAFDPNSPPFTCTYWRNHPTLIWGLFGWWGTTVGSAFGVSSLPGFGSNMSLLQALSNTRADGYGELYREGTAALLNSMAHTKFPYTATHVRDSFVAALSSNKASAAQAQLFKLANEGRIKPRA